jgi:hypothetical protein
VDQPFAQPEIDQPNEQPQDMVQVEPDQSQVFWAAKKGRDFCSAAKEKQRAYFETARKRGLLGQWIISYAALHGLDPDSMSTMQTQQLGFDGDEQEFLRLCINVYRPYLQRQVTTIVPDNPTLKCRASNTDVKSILSAKIGDEVVNGIFKKATKGGKLSDMCMAALCTSGGYMHTRWDPQAGDMVTVQQPIQNPQTGQPLQDPNTGAPVTRNVRKKSGAPSCYVAYPWTVIQEPEAMDCDSWKMVRVADNKWNLAETYAPQSDPSKADLRQRILNAKDDDEFDFGTLFGFEGMDSNNEDACVAFHFYYPRSVAIPSGRYCIFLGDDILLDTDCPIPEGVPVAEMVPARFITTTFGYAPGWDLLGIQQALNQIVSDQLSNIATFGRQSVAMEKGTEITVDALATGQKGFFYPFGGKPPTAVLMNDIGQGPTVLQQYLHKMLDFVAGSNPTARGTPEANVTSGTFAALLYNTVNDYLEYGIKSMNTAIEKIANDCIDMLRLFGESTFIVEAVGIENRTYMKEYTQEDIAGFPGAIMEVVPSAMNSYAGRLDMFDKLKDYAPEDRAAAYAMITTGRSDEFMRNDRNSAVYIQRENEWLIEGKTQPVTVQGIPQTKPDGTPMTLPMAGEYDDPTKHFPAHVAARNGLLASDNPDLDAVKRIDDHLAEHLVQYGNMHPFAASFLKIPAPPPQPGTPAFQLACMMAQGQFLIGQAGMGAQPGQLATVQPPQPGEAGSMQPGKPGAGGKSTGPGGPGASNTNGAAQPTNGGPNPDGVPLPRAANPPPNAQVQG